MVRILTDSMRLRVMDVLGGMLYRTLTEDDSCPCCGYGFPVRKFCERCDGDLADADRAKGLSDLQCLRSAGWRRAVGRPPGDRPGAVGRRHCGCDRPGWSRLPCGHCSMRERVRWLRSQP